MLNICFFISDVNKSSNLEWMFRYLKSSKIKISCVLLRNANTPLESFLINSNISFLRLDHGKKNVLRNVIKSIVFLKKQKINAVHCHLFEASLVGLISAYFRRIKIRIHTRHNSLIHHEYHPKAVKYDKLINAFSTKIISISDVVTDILIRLEHVDPKKIIKIHHGFDFNEMAELGDKYSDEIRDRYNLCKDNFNIGVISRYIKYKGVEYIIEAFKIILVTIPNAKLILANADGPEKKMIEKLLNQLPENSYQQIAFEPNIYSLIANFDVFIHTPIHLGAEAFGQVYIEAMFFKTPIIFTRSGIANEVFEDKVNGLEVGYKNSGDIVNAVLLLYNDKILATKIAANAKSLVIVKFGIEQMISQLKKVYEV